MADEMVTMQEVAPGVLMPASARRVLYDQDPRGDDYRAAAEEVVAIRRTLSDLRHRLYMLYATVDRGAIPSDSSCLAASGALSLVVQGLYKLIDDGRWSLQQKAARADELWADVEANPDRYVIEFGKQWWSKERRADERRRAEANGRA